LDNFVLATDEVWRLQGGSDFNEYQKSGGSDPECLCFQKMASQGHYGAGGGTKQGIYVCTPDGEFLASINSLSGNAVATTLKQAIAQWKEKLPNAAATPMAKSTPTHRWEWSYPESGLVLKQTTRYLSDSPQPLLERDKRFNFDFVWFNPSEVMMFIPKQPEMGMKFDLPQTLFDRFARFHFIETAHGENGIFHQNEISGKLQGEVIDLQPDSLTIAITGKCHSLSNRKAYRGLSPARQIKIEVYGSFSFNSSSKEFDKFELVAKGRIFNSSDKVDSNADSRSIGWYFTVADPTTPSERLSPTHLHAYGASWVKQPSLPLYDLKAKKPNQP
jgi:hypothetical protein